jgi:hypothetical protein
MSATSNCDAPRRDPLNDRLLKAIGDRAAEIQERPVVTKWPHIGSAFDGLVIVGQAA